MFIFVVVRHWEEDFPWCGTAEHKDIVKIVTTFEEAKEVCGGEYCNNENYYIEKWEIGGECVNDMYWEWE